MFFKAAVNYYREGNLMLAGGSPGRRKSWRCDLMHSPPSSVPWGQLLLSVVYLVTIAEPHSPYLKAERSLPCKLLKEMKGRKPSMDVLTVVKSSLGGHTD